jgi:hypothetical protein
MTTKKLDTRSALLGLGAGILVTVALGAALPTTTPGRFQVAGTGNQAVIVDTATGQAWTAHYDSSSGKTDGEFYLPKLGERR